jgi:lipopolysaccharide biosynthesis glycosyltransferase
MTGRNAVAVMSDARFFPAAVFLCDRLSSLNNRADTDVILFADSEKDVAAARDLGARFVVRTIDPALAAKFPIGRPLTRRLFYKFNLPDLLAGAYDRVLSVDVDAYPESSGVFALFDLDMHGYVIAAVRGWLNAAGVGEARTVLRNGGTKYLDSTVLLVDIAGFRAAGMPERLLEVARSRPVPLAHYDQSMLNYVLDGDWLELSPSFNMIMRLWKSPMRQAFDPVIVHFSGTEKPWPGSRFEIDHAARREFERFVAATPWKRFRAASSRPVDAARPDRRVDARLAARLRSDILDHLRNGVFADVAQGITTRRSEHL